MLPNQICLLIAFMCFHFQGSAQFLPTTITYSYTGSMQQFTVPPCVGSMTIEAKGASGGAGGGGGPTGANGGSVKGVFTATPGSVMYMFVGGQGSVTAGGFNGGANGGSGSATSGAGGGGASDVRIGGATLADRIIVAGAGGGAGGSFTANPAGGVGGGGNPFSVASGYGGGGAAGACGLDVKGGDNGGFAVCAGASGGGGGYFSGGMGGGITNTISGSFGCAGTLGSGGIGGGSIFSCGGTSIGVNGGGGGGGGYYGGGGGMSGILYPLWGGPCNAGGAGGSSWANNSIFTNLSYTAGNNSGHGSITISYVFNGLQINATANPSAICVGSSAQLAVSGANNYTWSTNAISNTISVSPAISSIYSVAATNSIGCFASTTLAVLVNTSIPSLSISSSTTSVCPSNTVSLNASGGNSNFWSGGVSNGIPFAPLGTAQYTATAQNACGTSTAAITITVTPLLLSAVVNPPILCAGTTATLSSSGATTYTWQPGGFTGSNNLVSPVANTIYTVTGTFGLCVNNSTVGLAVTPSPTLTTSSSSWSVCSGSSATLSALGANNYTWQPGNQTGSSIVVTPGASTVYVVTGANNMNCVSNSNLAVVVFSVPNVSGIASNTALCPGNSVTLSASGANSYLWSNGSTSSSLVVNPASSSTYSVTGTNTTSGCSASASLSVLVFISSLTLTPPSALCLGGTVNLIASGANSYTWSTGSTGSSISISPVISSTYSVQALSNFSGLNCASSGTTSVTVYPLPIVTALASKTIVCKNSPSTTLTAGGAQTYVWSTSSTSQSIVVTPAVSTVYTVTGTDSNNCVNSFTLQILVNPCTVIEEALVEGDQMLLVYPNPSRSVFTVKAERAMELILLNELGQAIRKLELSTENNFEVQVSHLAAGIYFIQSKENSAWLKHKVFVQD